MFIQLLFLWVFSKLSTFYIFDSKYRYEQQKKKKVQQKKGAGECFLFVIFAPCLMRKFLVLTISFDESLGLHDSCPYGFERTQDGVRL